MTVPCLCVSEAPEEELELASSISQMWSDLFAEARTVDRSLGRVKKTFTEVSVLPPAQRFFRNVLHAIDFGVRAVRSWFLVTYSVAVSKHGVCTRTAYIDALPSY